MHYHSIEHKDFLVIIQFFLFPIVLLNCLSHWHYILYLSWQVAKGCSTYDLYITSFHENRMDCLLCQCRYCFSQVMVFLFFLCCFQYNELVFSPPNIITAILVNYHYYLSKMLYKQKVVSIDEGMQLQKQ